MPLSNHHRIRRQVIELELPSGMVAPQAQAALAEEMRARVMPALAAVFDAAAQPHELLRLNRLEIDLGTIAAANWLPKFRERLVEEVTRGIARFRPEASGPRGHTERDTGADAMRLLLHFLAQGRLPWWGARPEGGFRALFAEGGASLDWRALRECLQGDARAVARLIEALDDTQLDAGIMRWCGLSHTAAALAVLAPAADAGALSRWRRRGWRLVLDWVLDDGFHAGREQELVRALRRLARELAPANSVGSTPIAAQSWASPPAGRVALADLPSPWREWLVLPAEVGEAPPVRIRRADRKPVAPVRGARPTPAKAWPDAAANGEEAVYLPGAGVILLHPFLETLFRERDLLVGRGFRDDVARVRAVRLVGLLAFGRADVPEYDLPIAKLLCGRPLDEVVEGDLPDDDDVLACDTLLDAALGHWQALRSSSKAWLRAQFFLRDGKLESVDAGFRLTVERHAQDALLARLPWGLGVIAMPWMKEEIFVHWLD